MAGQQSITFSFLSVGADRLGGDLRKTGDNATLAAKGAKVLADTIAQLGAKEDRTAGESKILAAALRQTGDAADRMSAKTVLADAAIRRLDDAMQDVSKKPMVPEVLTGKALKSLTGIQVRADTLKARFPEYTVKIDDAAAKAKLALFAVEAKGTLDKIDRSFSGSGSAGILGRLFGGGAGAAGGAGPAASSGAPLLGALGGPGTIAAVAGGLAALPFVAQLAGGGIVAALGGALAGVAIIGASRTKAVQASFAGLKTSASADLTKIGSSFVPVMTGILGTATSVLGKLTPVFAGSAKIISGPFKSFSDTLIRAFGQPSVKQSITDVAAAFGKILTAVTPGLARGVGQIATGVSKLAGAVAANPKALSQFTGFLFAAAGGALTAIAALTRTATYIEQHFIPAFVRARHDVAHWWDVMITGITATFDIFKENIRITWDKIKLLFLGGVDFILVTMGHLPGPLGAPFRAAHASIRQSMAGIQADVKTATANIQADFDRLHGKTVQIHMNGQGLYTITGKIIAASQGKGGSGNAAGGLAAGGFISGGTPGRDSVFAALMPGEVVVPVRMVKAGAVDHLRGQLPGFAGGGQVSGPLTAPFVSGMYSSFQNQMTGAMTGAMRTSLKTAEATAVAAAKAAAAAGSSVPGGGGGAGRWKSQILTALGMLNQPGSLLGAVEHRMNQESGGNQFAVNKWDSNWAAGTPSVGVLQVIGPTYASNSPPGWRNLPPMAYGVSEDVLANTYAGLHHAITAYPGRSLASVMLQPGGYAQGGLVPKQGAAYLKAWKSRHGGGFGAAWAPIVLNEQIPRMQSAINRATVLSKAGGLSAGQHRFWAATAADEKKRLGVLHKELATERAWRGRLGHSDVTLAAEIAAAGNLPSLARNVTGWKAQIGRQKATIAGISAMLGYSDAYLAAHKPPPTGVLATHSYGGDIANNLGAVLAAALGPFTGAARGGQVFDRGGVLRPGFNQVWNKTGRPEALVPAGGGKLEVTLKLDSSFTAATGLTPQQVANIRATVRRVGGTGPGAVDRAFGNR
jgi:hypothetical protein